MKQRAPAWSSEAMLWFRKIRLKKYVPRMLPLLKGNRSHRMMPPGRQSLPPALQMSNAQSPCCGSLKGRSPFSGSEDRVPTSSGAAMQEIADWLQKRGLGQHAQRFAENDISVAVLPDLTDQDLKELGVASLGHRR
jgi:SAM domain (Sterile alpha motif)